MSKKSLFGVVTAFSIISASLLWAQTQHNGHEPSGSRYSITTTSMATLLLDAHSGETWILQGSGAEVSWQPIRKASVSAPALTAQTFVPTRWARVSPFTRVDFLEGDQVRVEYEQRNYTLVSMDAFSTAQLLRAARTAFPGQWEKRFVEDIVEVMEAAGKRPARTVKLVLRDDQGKLHAISKAPLTSANRQAAWRARNQSAPTNIHSLNPFFSGVPNYPNWSAFTGIRFEDDRPYVEFQGAWYELLEFHGVSVDEIRRACAKNGWPFEHRFTEDLVQLVRVMGTKIDRTANVALRDNQGKIVKHENVPMSEANQRRLLLRSRR